jgi:hypothetical protein
VKAWKVTHPDYEGEEIIHAETRSKARYRVWLRASQYIPIKLIDLHVGRKAEFDDRRIPDPTCRCELCQ